MEKIRFGIIGAGTQGMAYAGFLTGKNTHPDFPNPAPPQHAVLGALCGRSEATRARCKELFPDTPFYADYKELVRSGTVDAVIIATPHYQHPEMAAWCIGQGMPTLVEKPVGVYGAGVLPLQQAAAQHPEVPFGVMYNFRANSLWRRVHDLIAGGTLGSIRSSLWLVTNFYRPDSYYASSPARGTWGGEGGGVLTNQATHQLDLWQWLCGVPTAVYAQVGFGTGRAIPTDTQATLLTRYADGSTGCFKASVNDLDGEDSLTISLDGGSIRVTGGKRAVVRTFVRPEPQVNAETGPDALRKLTSGKGLGVPLYTEEVWEADEPWGTQHVAMMENFALHMLAGQPLYAPGTEGLRTVQLTNAALYSGWTRQEAAVPMDGQVYKAWLNERIAEEGRFPILP